MGIMESTTPVQPASAGKRKALSTDFSKLGPLKNVGGKGFAGYRDKSTGRRKDSRDDDDDDDDDEMSDTGDRARNDDDDEREAKGMGNGTNGEHLSAEELRRRGELAEGVERIHVSHVSAEFDVYG